MHPGDRGADAVDARLHAERVDPGTKGRRLHEERLSELPDGSFVLEEGEAHLVLGAELLRWTPAGYRERRARHGGRTTLITPPSLVEVLRQGWTGAVPLLHPSARAERA